MNVATPIVGQWYQSVESGQIFEVVSVDYGAIEIQDFNGNLDEMEPEQWLTLKLVDIDPPEDLAGVYDVELDECA